MSTLPPLVEKALADAGFDLLSDSDNGWARARISGGVPGEVGVRVVPQGTLLAIRKRGFVERIGLATTSEACAGMAEAGLAATPSELHRALRWLRALETHPAARLSAELEARLSRIPSTERTREVRQRIGQDVYREALMEFWDGRCARSSMALPSELLRASHAKAWADSDDSERLDPFNGLLLAVRYDALFDKGLITFDDNGCLLVSSSLTKEVCAFIGLDVTMHLRFILPGHRPYLRYHREHIAKL